MGNELNDKLKQVRDAASRALLKDLDFGDLYGADQLAEKCESPIESLLLAALISMFHKRHICDEGFCVGPSEPILVVPFSEAQERVIKFDDVVGELNFIDCQVKIDSYRADFVVGRWEHCATGIWLKTPYLVVECDGHDFHERTKEQAQRDKERDRDLQKLGFVVLRFTGSEIWKNAWGCALQINEFLDSKIREFYKSYLKEERRGACVVS